jgi:hypothetical protein
MALADFTDSDFEENYAPHLQRRQDWVILTPPLPDGAKKKAFLEQYGHKVAMDKARYTGSEGGGCLVVTPWPPTLPSSRGGYLKDRPLMRNESQC